jgi:hypothetical protein
VAEAHRRGERAVTLATIVLSILSLLVAVATGVFVWWQARLLRFSLQVQSLLALEKNFNAPEFRRIRHFAARDLAVKKTGHELDEVLNFFATLALLTERKALHVEMVYHTFFDLLDGYARAARWYIDEERKQNPNIWEDVLELQDDLRDMENEEGIQGEEPVEDFLKREVEQYREDRR